jgi:prolyl-tRNA synthetase
MLRAGLIRKLGSGLYHFLPMGLRSLRKIERIVRREMDGSGALEFLLPILTPSEVWERSGRWQTMGREMFRIEDRHNVWNVLGPTHEESFTDLMKMLLQSYRDLPVNVYQVHTKFRDEIRPRFGVMRSREFIMKDAYSFDIDEAGLDVTYQKMRRTYRRIFTAAGLKTLPVEADTGTMGGSASEEFMVPSDVGEETLLISEKELYRGNREKTPVIYRESIPGKGSTAKIEKIHTPGSSTIEKLCTQLKTDPKKILKSVLFLSDGKPLMVILRADRDVNEVKLRNITGTLELEAAPDETFRAIQSVAGYAGPHQIDPTLQIIWDQSTLYGDSWITGANERDYHIDGYQIPEGVERHDVALARTGDPSPSGDGDLHEVKGIEVGHIFKLGYKYTEAFGVSVLDEKGRPITPIMGCYGIGVNRTMAAVIEQHNDDKGISWPIPVAPFEICLIGITKTPEEEAAVTRIYEALRKEGCDIFYDDRPLRPGVKFSDAELIGFPIRITAGKGFFESGTLEMQIRENFETRILSGSLEAMIAEIVRTRDDLYAGYERGLEAI